MKQIPLSIKHGNQREGKEPVFAIVDDEDYDYLIQFNWSVAKSYRTLFYAMRGTWDKITHKKSCIQMHRLIMNCPQGMVIDHINHDGLDNRKENLRICTHAENSRNRKMGHRTDSKYKGVLRYKDKRRPKINKWKAIISTGGKCLYLGSYNTEKEAAIAYNAKAKELFGEFAYLNVIVD